MYCDKYYDFLKKAEAGEEHAMSCLAECLLGDVNNNPIEGFPHNPREAERWYNKIIENSKDVELKRKALAYLTTEYRSGILLPPKDLDKAKKYYKDAADLGDEYSKKALEELKKQSTNDSSSSKEADDSDHLKKKKTWIPHIVGIFLGLCFAAAKGFWFGVIGGVIAWYIMSLFFKGTPKEVRGDSPKSPKKGKKSIEKTPQYQIYLEVLEALKQAGYQIKEVNVWQTLVKKGDVNHGQVFVVDYPKGLASISSTIRMYSNYETMKRVIKDINNSRKRGKTYWSENNLVGGFTSDSTGTYDDKWINILAFVVSKYQ